MSTVPRRILHIDDDPQVTQLVAGHFAQRNIEMIALNDPISAITYLVKERPSIVLLDIDMPMVDGMLVLRQIKSLDGALPVIMLTSMVTKQAVQESMRIGAEACVFKPLADFTELDEAVEDAFRKLTRWWHTQEAIRKHRQACAPCLYTPAWPPLSLPNTTATAT